MSIDDILFSPICLWRDKCRRIEQQLNAKQAKTTNVYQLNRNRPPGSLTLLEMMEAFHLEGKRWFWRIEATSISIFEFVGEIWEENEKVPFACYGQVDPSAPDNRQYRSIADVNLVQNAYTNYFIFRTEAEAKSGVHFLTMP